MLGITLPTLIEFIRVEKNLKDQNGPNFKDQKFIDENKNKQTKKPTPRGHEMKEGKKRQRGKEKQRGMGGH